MVPIHEDSRRTGSEQTRAAERSGPSVTATSEGLEGLVERFGRVGCCGRGGYGEEKEESVADVSLGELTRARGRGEYGLLLGGSGGS